MEVIDHSPIVPFNDKAHLNQAQGTQSMVNSMNLNSKFIAEQQIQPRPSMPVEKKKNQTSIMTNGSRKREMSLSENLDVKMNDNPQGMPSDPNDEIVNEDFLDDSCADIGRSSFSSLVPTHRELMRLRDDNQELMNIIQYNVHNNSLDLASCDSLSNIQSEQSRAVSIHLRNEDELMQQEPIQSQGMLLGNGLDFGFENGQSPSVRLTENG